MASGIASGDAVAAVSNDPRLRAYLNLVGSAAPAKISTSRALLTKGYGSEGDGGSAAVALLRAVLEAGNGKMPPSMISDIAASLHLVWSTLGTEAFQRLLLLALGDEHDAFPKAKTTMEDKKLWVNSLTTDTARMDARVFKRLLKAFFGGKKVGSNL